MADPATATGGAGIGLSSVAATRLGTSVPVAARGTASGIINTAAQLGTAVGIATLLLVAALSTGIPEPGSPVPAIAWGITALISFAGAVIFGLRSAVGATAFRPAVSDRQTAAGGIFPGLSHDPPSFPQAPIPGDWARCLESAKPIACDATTESALDTVAGS
jgi:hypothetical protein